jgi:hypothetical protein
MAEHAPSKVLCMKCSRCGLENPDSAEVCDCGWSFLHARQEESLLTPAERARYSVIEQRHAPEVVRRMGRDDLQIGAAWSVGGALVLAATLEPALPASAIRWVVCSLSVAAAIYGLARLGRGAYQVATGNDHPFFHLGAQGRPYAPVKGVVKLAFVVVWASLVWLAQSLGSVERATLVLYTIAGILSVLVVLAIVVARSKRSAAPELR